MDGNGRWAKQRGLPRTEGHKRGEAALFDVVEGAIEIGVTHLSAYAFSTENWKRSPDEVRFLMGFNRDVIRRRRDDMHALGVRVRWAGRRPRLWRSVIKELEVAEQLTANNRVLTLTMCVNYGGRAEIADAAKAIAAEAAAGRLDPAKVDERMLARYLDEPDMPDVDMFLRPSGEQRTSNFLIWQSAYAELVFQDTLFPDFDRRDLWRACEVYASRQRRFGGVSTLPRTAARRHHRTRDQDGPARRERRRLRGGRRTTGGPPVESAAARSRPGSGTGPVRWRSSARSCCWRSCSAGRWSRCSDSPVHAELVDGVRRHLRAGDPVPGARRRRLRRDRRLRPGRLCSARCCPTARSSPCRWPTVCGAALPGCECGSVPISNRLIERGVRPSASLAFMLSAPAINPIVLVATAVAFTSEPKMVWARLIAGLLTAVIVGWIWERIGRPEWMRPRVPVRRRRPVGVAGVPVHHPRRLHPGRRVPGARRGRGRDVQDDRAGAHHGGHRLVAAAVDRC